LLLLELQLPQQMVDGAAPLVCHSTVTPFRYVSTRMECEGNRPRSGTFVIHVAVSQGRHRGARADGDHTETGVVAAVDLSTGPSRGRNAWRTRERRSAMSWHRSSGVSVVAIVVFALLTASPALGVVAGIDRDVLTGTGGGHPGRDLTLP
jgi:hypothetical protein